MASPRPTVTVVIAAHNAARYLSAALDSVLSQSWQDLEIVVVDDGSSDDTAGLLGRYGSSVRSLTNPTNVGVALARNRGIEAARGRYIAFLDADDAWLPAKLERQLELLERTRLAACHCGFFDADSDLQPQAVHPSLRRGSALEDLLLVGNAIGPPSTVMAERAVVLDVGAFDPSTHYCSDWDLWLRLARRSEFAFVEEPLVLYRHHGAQFSRQLSLLEEDSVRMLEKALRGPGLPSHVRGRQAEIMGRNYMVLAGTYFSAGQYRDCLRCAGRAIRLSPRQVHYLVGYPARTLRRHASNWLSRRSLSDRQGSRPGSSRRGL